MVRNTVLRFVSDLLTPLYKLNFIKVLIEKQFDMQKFPIHLQYHTIRGRFRP